MYRKIAGSRGTSVIALSLAALTLAVPAPARADDREAEGLVAEVAAPPAGSGYGVLVLDTREGRVQFVLSAETRIEVDDRAATLADVHPGHQAEVNFVLVTSGETSTRVAREIEVESPSHEVAGLVTEVVKDPATNVVSVTVDPPIGDAVKLNVDGSTEVEIGEDEDVVLSELPDLAVLKGAYAKAEYFVSGDVATAKEIKFKRPRPIRFKGLVESVDPPANTLVVTVEHEGEAKSLTLVVLPVTTASFTMPASSQIRRDGHSATLSDLQPGDRCEGGFALQQGTDGSVKNVVIIIHAKTPRPVEFSGTINGKAVVGPTTAGGKSGEVSGANLGSLELTRRDGTHVTVQVYAGTRVKVNGKETPFSSPDLAAGQWCNVLCVPRLVGKNPDGTYNWRYDAFRVQARKPRASTGTGS